MLRLAFRWSLVLLLSIPAALAVIRIAAWMREGDDHIPAQLRMIDTPLGQVAVDRRGARTGPTVLIVPGTAGWSGFWREVTMHLAARGYQVIAVDLPPFGYSQRDIGER